MTNLLAGLLLSLALHLGLFYLIQPLFVSSPAVAPSSRNGAIPIEVQWLGSVAPASTDPLSGEAGLPAQPPLADNWDQGTTDPVTPGPIHRPPPQPRMREPASPIQTPQEIASLVQPVSAPVLARLPVVKEKPRAPSPRVAELPLAKPESEERVVAEKFAVVVSLAESLPAQEADPLPSPRPVSPTGPVHAVSASAGSDSVRRESLEEDYRHRLRELIAAGKEYPIGARRRQQQGTAVVSFTLLADGSLSQLELSESSGNRSLDRAALRAVETVGGRLPFPDGLLRSEWHFTLPLVYRLN